MNDLELLCRHAWLLMDWRNAIRANEEWCQIPVNIMAATSPCATIGAYLEFWEDEGCVECSHDSNAAREGVMIGTLGLVCKISDNPGTGIVAWGDGKISTEDLSEIYRDFHQACLNNPLPEETSKHNLSWLIEQVKQKRKKMKTSSQVNAQYITEWAKLNMNDDEQSEFPSNAYRVWVQGENSPYNLPCIYIRDKQDGYEVKVSIKTGKLSGVNAYGTRSKSDTFEDVLEMMDIWFDRQTTMPGRTGTNRETAMNEWEACNAD